jgi:hypothetical protein
MAWSTPRTWSVGDLLTAALMNIIRDLLNSTVHTNAAASGVKLQSGSTAYTVTGATAVTVNITFPEAFTTAPIVTASIETTSLHRAYAFVSGPPSTSLATIRVQQGENTTDTFSGLIYWVAVGT